MNTIIGVCMKHPAYKALREPRCRCRVCWVMWTARLDEKLQAKNKEYDELAEQAKEAYRTALQCT